MKEEMPMPNIFNKAEDKELEGWNVKVDYTLPSNTLIVSPDVFSAIAEFGRRKQAEDIWKVSF